VQRVADAAVQIPYLRYQPFRISLVDGRLYCHPLVKCHPHNYWKLSRSPSYPHLVLRRFAEAIDYAISQGIHLPNANLTIQMEDCPRMWRTSASKNAFNLCASKDQDLVATRNRTGGFDLEFASDLPVGGPDGGIPNGLLLSTSSYPAHTWDIPALPYFQYNNDEETWIRTNLTGSADNGMSQEIWKRMWGGKREAVFFVGRMTDESRVRLACEMSVLDPALSDAFYIADGDNPKTPGKNCTGKALELQRKLGCKASHICRAAEMSSAEWQRQLLTHKYHLDLVGFGPWSHRLRLSLLSGAVVFQDQLNFLGSQFYDSPLKRLLLVPFSSARDLQRQVQWFQKNDAVARQIAWVGHRFAWDCLSREGIRQFLVALVRRLGQLQREQNTRRRRRRPSKANEKVEDIRHCDLSHRIPLTPSTTQDFKKAVHSCETRPE